MENTIEFEICRRTSKTGGGWCKIAIIISLIYAICAIIATLIIGICNEDVFPSRCEECDDATFNKIASAHRDYDYNNYYYDYHNNYYYDEVYDDDFVSKISEYFEGDQTKAMYFIKNVAIGRDAEILAEIVDYYTELDSSYEVKCSAHSYGSGSDYFEGLYWIGHGNTLLGIFCAIVFAILMILLSKTYTMVLTNKRIHLTIEKKTLFNKKIALTESYQLNKLIGYTLLEIKKKKYTISQLSFKTSIGQRSIYIDTDFYTQFVEAVNNAV